MMIGKVSVDLAKQGRYGAAQGLNDSERYAPGDPIPAVLQPRSTGGQVRKRAASWR